MILTLLACDPAVPVGGDDTAGPGDGNRFTMLVGTTDYASGVLARIDVTDGAAAEDLFPVAADVAVETQGDTTFVLGRSSENTVRVYDALDFSAPRLELSTGDGTNPQDAALCGDTLVVSLLAEDHLALFDAAGLAAGTIDLSAWDDGDGSPEADGIHVGPDGDLYVALGRLDTSTDWTSADGTGAIVQVDCDTLTIVNDWTTGPNPGLSPYPGDPSKLLLRTGDYFDADWNMKLDGALAAFDPVAGTLGEPLLTEEAYGRNLGALVGDADHAMLVTDDGYSWNIACVDLATWAITATDPVDSFLSDGVWGPDGRAWMVYRAGFAGNGDPQIAGIVPWDPATCTAGDPVTTTLPPSSLALVP